MQTNRFKGQAVTSTVIAVVIVSVMMMVGTVVFGYARNAMTTPMSSLGSTNLNTTITNMETNAYSGFNLVSVSVIVLAAVSIIATIFLLRPSGG